MTANQINALRYQEEKRSNYANEALTRKQREIDQAKLAETQRHNREDEERERKLGTIKAITGGISDVMSIATGIGSGVKAYSTLKGLSNKKGGFKK